MQFYKYYANGNDFVIFASEKKEERSELAKKLCDRYLGIGADGLIAIMPHENYAFEWDFYNRDGSKATMCGNGARAAAHFASHILNKGEKFEFLSGAGAIRAQVQNDEVEIKFGKFKELSEDFFDEKLWSFGDSGVPHLVHFCENLNEFDESLAKKMREKYNANVNFVKVVDKNTLKVRTFERGVEAETLACGTGMAACFYFAHKKGLCEEKAKIYPKSEEEIKMRLEQDEIYFKGKVRLCFEAKYNF